MLEKEVEWWSLPSALTIYCYCLHRLIVYLKFVSTKRDNYLAVNIKWTLFLTHSRLLFYFVFRTRSICFRSIYQLQMALGV